MCRGRINGSNFESKIKMSQSNFKILEDVIKFGCEHIFTFSLKLNLQK